jgi:dihydrofolate reductase
MSELNAICAMSGNGVIAKNGKIPWHLPLDFKWFQHKTTNGVIVMGRKTFESIGKLLPNRHTIVLTQNKELVIPDVEICTDINQLKDRKEEVIWVCGGALVYEMLLYNCKYLYLTVVKKDILEPDIGDKLLMFPIDAVYDYFIFEGVIYDNDDFVIRRYINRSAIVKDLKDEWPFS